jgi:hypothetical protein
MDKLLEKIEVYLIYAVVVLFPITVLNISPNPFVVPKLSILSFGIALILLVRAIRVISTGKLNLNIGTFDFPVFLLAAAYVASTVLRSPNKMEALLLPGTATAVVAGALLYYLVNQLNDMQKDTVVRLFAYSAGVFSLMTLLAFSGLFGKVPQLPAFLKSQGFTPEGGFLPAAILLATVLPLAAGQFLQTKDAMKKGLVGASTALILFAFAISIYNLLPGRPFSPRFPSYGTSWSISVDALKESPIFGVGPGNYLTAFNRFRPINYNTTDLWAIKFATARSYYFTALTEVGMLGAAGIILLLLAIYRTAKRDMKERKLVGWGFAANAPVVSLILLVVAMAFFPATILLLVMFFFYLSLIAKTRRTTLNLTAQQTEGSHAQIAGVSTERVASRFPALLISVPVMIILVLFGIRATNILRAEYQFKKSLDALVANDARGTYDMMRSAIQLNPFVDRYHSTFSRVNLILANAIAQNEDITDQDRVNITQLIQQSISEGKATVALNPLRAGNWEVLARTYQAIIPFAQGADAFAIQTFRQAVALDPINPNLRIALGGVHYARGDYNSAIRVFELVTTAVKPDLANAHYNLAFAYAQNNQLDLAINEMTTVLSLVDKTSPDYEVARQALEQLQEQQKAQAPQGEALTPPQEGEEPVLEPPLDLPEGSEPPESPLTPTPTPEEGAEGATGTGTGSPSPSPQTTPTPTP